MTCKSTQNLISSERKCFDEILSQFNQGQKPLNIACEQAVNSSAPLAQPPAPKDCNNLAAYLCDERNNRYFENVESTIRQIDFLQRQIELETKNNPKIQNLLKVNNASSCSELKTAELKECMNLMYKNEFDKIFTPERVALAQKQFDLAKKELLQYLSGVKERLTEKAMLTATEEKSEKQKDLELKKIAAQQERLNLAMAQVQDAVPEFGEEADNVKVQYGSHMRGSVASQKWKIHLGAEILLVDGKNGSPGLLRSTYYHELSHIVSFIALENQEANPFQDITRCLSNDDAIGVKANDTKCVERLVEKYKNDPRQKSFVSEAQKKIKQMQQDPWSAPNSFENFPENEMNCQMGQMNEGLTDWLQSQLIGADETARSKEISSPNGGAWYVKTRVAKYCSWYLQQTKDGVTRQSNRGEHLTHEDRINRLYLGTPFMRKLMGCEPLPTESKKGGGTFKYCDWGMQ